MDNRFGDKLLSPEREETLKIFPSYYEYSSDDDLFETTQHEVSNKDAYKVKYEHGTLMCKVVSAIVSHQTSIHMVKCPIVGNNERHIRHCLSYVDFQARKLNIKRNVILITLRTEKFR